MAENRVEIIVTSKNETKEGFAAAKKDAEKAGDEAGKSFSSKLGSSLKKGFGDLFGTGGKGISGSLSGTPLVGGLLNSTGIYGLAAVATAVAALLPEVVGLVSGFAAATAGVGAFALVAGPAFSNVQQDAQALVSAWDALQLAQDKYAISPSTTTLKALRTAQLNVQAIQMSMGQDAGSAAVQLLKLRDAYNQLTNSLNPIVYKVLGDALKAVTTLIPDLKPFAQAAGTAIDGLLGKLTKFLQSADFKKWLAQFVQNVGPAITAIGEGVGKVLIDFGKLLTLMSHKDVVLAIKTAFYVLDDALLALYWTVKGLMISWDSAWHLMKTVALTVVGGLIDGLAKAFGWLPGGIGKDLKDAAHQFDLFRADAQGQTGAVAGYIQGLVGTIGGIGPAVQAAAQALAGLGGSAGSALGATANAAGGTAGHPHINIAVGGSGTGLDHLFLQYLKQTIRVQGGGGKNSVQIALGQTH